MSIETLDNLAERAFIQEAISAGIEKLSPNQRLALNALGDNCARTSGVNFSDSDVRELIEYALSLGIDLDLIEYTAAKSIAQCQRGQGVGYLGDLAIEPFDDGGRLRRIGLAIALGPARCE